MFAKFKFSPICNHLILTFSKIWKLLHFGKIGIPKKIGQHLAKFSKILANLVKILWKVQSLTKCWELTTVQRSALCKSRRELSNEYFLAKFLFDTAENEPCKIRMVRSLAYRTSQLRWSQCTQQRPRLRQVRLDMCGFSRRRSGTAIWRSWRRPSNRQEARSRTLVSVRKRSLIFHCPHSLTYVATSRSRH